MPSQRKAHTANLCPALFSTTEVKRIDGPVMKLKVLNIHGIHARPAAAIVRTLDSFSSEVAVTYRKRTANGRSVLGLLMLGVPCGSHVTIKAAGPDADAVLVTLEALFKKQFHEGVYDCF